MILGAIPARYNSKRLPAKPLIKIDGKPMVIHVLERALECKALDEVIVLTDHLEIKKTVEDTGGKAFLTPANLPSGTDRVAWFVKKHPQYEVIVNIQGDEPLIDPLLIEKVALKSKDSSAIVTAAREVYYDQGDDRVKVVVDKKWRALYFSRAAIPYSKAKKKVRYLEHIGIYGFKRDLLLKFVSFPQSFLEKTEKLEQLRALENGIPIEIVLTSYKSIPVDKKEDIEKVVKILHERRKI